MRTLATHSPLTLSDTQLETFARYADLLLEWNTRVNLTAITERDAVVVKHFLDALILIPLIEQRTERRSLRVIDVGTGGGVPGIALAIARPAWEVTLLDATRKKVSAVQEMIEELELPNVHAVWGRAEEVGDQPAHREQYDVAVARAVAELRELVEYCLPFVRVGGYLFAPKGADVADEVEAAGNALNVLGGSLVEVVPVTVPTLEEAQTAVIVEKTSTTPDKYPRRPGRPGKRPL